MSPAIAGSVIALGAMRRNAGTHAGTRQDGLSGPLL